MQTETEVIRQPEEPRRNIRSWIIAMTLTFASFMATLGTLSLPVVEGAVVYRPDGTPIERRFEKLPAAVDPPIIRASKPMLPTVKLTSRPSGASVLDAHGDLIGKTPLQVRSPDGALTAELVMTHAGFKDKRLSVTFANQSLLAVMAHPDKIARKKR